MAGLTARLWRLIDAWLGEPDQEAALDALQDALEDEPGALFGDEQTRYAALKARLQAQHTLEKLVDPDWQPTSEEDWDAVEAALKAELLTPPPAAPSPPPMRGRLRWWGGGISAVAAAAAIAITILPESEEAVALISAEEASLAPLQRVTRGTPQVTAGPHIAVILPEHGTTYDGRFPLELTVTAEPDVPLDEGTLRVTYLRGEGLNVTERLPILKEDGHLVVQVLAEAPQGTHRFEVYIEDIEQRPAIASFSVQVR